MLNVIHKYFLEEALYNEKAELKAIENVRR